MIGRKVTPPIERVAAQVSISLVGWSENETHPFFLPTACGCHFFLILVHFLPYLYVCKIVIKDCLLAMLNYLSNFF